MVFFRTLVGLLDSFVGFLTGLYLDLFIAIRFHLPRKKSQAAYLDHCFMQSRFVKIFSCLNCCIRLTRKLKKKKNHIKCEYMYTCIYIYIYIEKIYWAACARKTKRELKAWIPVNLHCLWQTEPLDTICRHWQNLLPCQSIEESHLHTYKDKTLDTLVGAHKLCCKMIVWTVDLYFKKS